MFTLETPPPDRNKRTIGTNQSEEFKTNHNEDLKENRICF